MVSIDGSSKTLTVKNIAGSIFLTSEKLEEHHIENRERDAECCTSSRDFSRFYCQLCEQRLKTFDQIREHISRSEHQINLKVVHLRNVYERI